MVAPMRRARRSAAVALGLGVCAAAAHAGPVTSRPADSLTGHVSATRGQWRHHQGRLSIRLAPSGTGSTRHLTLHIAGVRCGAQKMCLRLRGTLHGTLTALLGNPDTGRTFSVKARGTLAPLGQVKASGTVTGTGSVIRSRVTLRLTFTTGRGSVSVRASSAPVPSFTSP
jgi:hypothetical protein